MEDNRVHGKYPQNSFIMKQKLLLLEGSLRRQGCYRYKVIVKSNNSPQNQRWKHAHAQIKTMYGEWYEQGVPLTNNVKPSPTMLIIEADRCRHALGLFSRVSNLFSSSKETKIPSCEYTHRLKERGPNLIGTYAKGTYVKVRWGTSQLKDVAHRFPQSNARHSERFATGLAKTTRRKFARPSSSQNHSNEGKKQNASRQAHVGVH